MRDNVVEKPDTFIYRFAHFAVKAFFSTFYRLRVRGLDNIPSHGGVIIASNHLSNFDPPLIGICVPRYIKFMGKAELFHVPLLRSLFHSLGGFPIQRGKIDKSGIRTAIHVVQEGGCLVMFPEGHRSKNGQLGAFLPGVASIAKKAEGLVIPTAIIGNYRMFSRLEVRFGKPISVETLKGAELLAELSARIQELLGNEHI